MAEPILNIRCVPSGVHEMHRDRMAEYVRMSAVLWQPGRFRVPAEELVNRGRRHRPVIALARGE